MKLADDQSWYASIRESLFGAVIGDVLDAIGLQRQFLPPRIKPLDPQTVIVGRAMPVVEEDRLPVDSRPPFGLMLEALDDLRPGEIYVASGGSPQYACWGELMSIRAQQLGAGGAVLDGFSRDTKRILDLSFPTFSCGQYSQDQLPRGAVTDFRVPIQIEMVRIEPGDLIFGDLDGVVVIPKAVEEETIRRAMEKVGKESSVRSAILGGMSAVEAFRNFAVL